MEVTSKEQGLDLSRTGRTLVHPELVQSGLTRLLGLATILTGAEHSASPSKVLSGLFPLYNRTLADSLHTSSYKPPSNMSVMVGIDFGAQSCKVA
jgi:hypothetical protein